MAIPQKKSLWCPSDFLYVCAWVSVCLFVCVRMCVLVCQGTDTALSCGHYANEQWRCWDLKAVAQLSQAKPMIHSHPNIYTSAGITRRSCQCTRNNGTPDGRPKHVRVYAERTHTQTQRRLIRSLMECSPCNRLTREARILISKLHTHS